MEHTHETTHGFWAEYISLLTDPAHLLFELTFTVAFDGLIIALLYGIVFKKFILPKIQKKMHQDFHDEHGLDSDDCDPEEVIQLVNEKESLSDHFTVEEISELKKLLAENKQS